MTRRPSRIDRLRLVVIRLWDAGANGLEIKETTPKLGGLRERDAEMLVKSGRATWIVPCKRVRASYFNPHS